MCKIKDDLIFAKEYLDRVAKCHGYDEYFLLEIFAGWGKKFGGKQILQNQAFFGKICTA